MKLNNFSIAKLIVLVSVVGCSLSASAATFHWTQNTWSGGASINHALHLTNQTGWTYYASSTGVMLNGSNQCTLLLESNGVN